MDGENNGKPYEQMDDLGGKPTIFGNIHIWSHLLEMEGGRWHWRFTWAQVKHPQEKHRDAQLFLKLQRLEHGMDL